MLFFFGNAPLRKFGEAVAETAATMAALPQCGCAGSSSLQPTARVVLCQGWKGGGWDTCQIRGQRSWCRMPEFVRLHHGRAYGVLVACCALLMQARQGGERRLGA
eukprot:6774811-Prorocentrum_lima.AAC.1